MSCNKKPQASSSARDHFIESVRRDLSFDQSGSKIDTNKSCGTVVAKVNRFNPSMDRMKGTTLIKKGEEDWLWEVEGDPNLIDRRLGGKAKRPRDKSSDDEEVQVEEVTKKAPEIIHIMDSATLDPKEGTSNLPCSTVVRATRTTKRIRVSDPIGLAGHNKTTIDLTESGPSRNTRSKAGGSLRGRCGRGGRRASSSAVPARKASGSTARETKQKVLSSVAKWKGKGKAVEDGDQVAEITAGIDGFSVFSNLQTDIQPVSGFIKLDFTEDTKIPGVNAGDWAHPVGHQSKVGLWLEDFENSGPKAPVDAPKSNAPSTVIGIL
ncbi:hypothetical protein CROQUDRAFT_651860 [Cronartium quercuum f. sp. fusiforme G11]|uniref:Uncharacterized protein n=1 Tax=Cronartium quercuum f. sp. fusiforme G11 TaxID=708437 RepID=A0A9P6THP3_9BASI|nr:hypothetical protein CROQUDRAFT_651860 [Cronartium quercuum f. sp. fusiforme G11]